MIIITIIVVIIVIIVIFTTTDIIILIIITTTTIFMTIIIMMIIGIIIIPRTPRTSHTAQALTQPPAQASGNVTRTIIRTSPDLCAQTFFSMRYNNTNEKFG